MKTALVGHTGFVGSNLEAHFEFSELYNSTNSHHLAGGEYGLVVFAAAYAEKWKANQDPESDRGHIAKLKDLIQGVKAREFILISTVDVYPEPVGVDETSQINVSRGHAYGRHRHELEQAARAVHPEALIVRLPALFGPGLKKNAFYDFIHNNDLHRLESRAEFQFYNLRNLWPDIQIARKAGLKLVNLCSPPVNLADLHQQVFGRPFNNTLDGPVPKYDVRSVHSHLWSAEGPYTHSGGQVLAEMRAFAALNMAEKKR